MATPSSFFLCSLTLQGLQGVLFSMVPRVNRCYLITTTGREILFDWGGFLLYYFYHFREIFGIRRGDCVWWAKSLGWMEIIYIFFKLWTLNATEKLNTCLFGGSSKMEGDFHQDLFKSFVATGWLCTSVLDKTFKDLYGILFGDHVPKGKWIVHVPKRKMSCMT